MTLGINDDSTRLGNLEEGFIDFDIVNIEFRLLNLRDSITKSGTGHWLW